jgi:hypothetical protein
VALRVTQKLNFVGRRFFLFVHDCDGGDCDGDDDDDDNDDDDDADDDDDDDYNDNDNDNDDDDDDDTDNDDDDDVEHARRSPYNHKRYTRIGVRQSNFPRIITNRTTFFNQKANSTCKYKDRRASASLSQNFGQSKLRTLCARRRWSIKIQTFYEEQDHLFFSITRHFNMQSSKIYTRRRLLVSDIV